MDLYSPILESTDLQQAAEINPTIKSDFNFPTCKMRNETKRNEIK
jgi:hypothetical protein